MQKYYASIVYFISKRKPPIEFTKGGIEFTKVGIEFTPIEFKS